MIKRGVIVAKIKPGCEDKVAAIFAESDKTELPKLVGCRHRSLYILGDLYVHYVETDSEFVSAVGNVRENPLFKEISKKLEPYISPYKPDWKDHRDATAVQFYSWDAAQ
jgi:cyclase